MYFFLSLLVSSIPPMWCCKRTVPSQLGCLPSRISALGKSPPCPTGAGLAQRSSNSKGRGGAGTRTRKKSQSMTATLPWGFSDIRWWRDWARSCEPENYSHSHLVLMVATLLIWWAAKGGSGQVVRACAGDAAQLVECMLSMHDCDSLGHRSLESGVCICNPTTWEL